MRATLKKLIVGLGLVIIIPGVAISGTSIKVIQIYNNLYNQAAGTTGVSATNVTIAYFNGSTQCDSSSALFRSYIQMNAKPGQSCANITSVQITAGGSALNSAIQVYDPTPVTIYLNDNVYAHYITLQDLGTGLAGVPASDGSISPLFSSVNGTILSVGTMGSVLVES